MPEGEISSTVTRWQKGLGKLCSTTVLLKELINSKYWEKKIFEEDTNDNDMVKAHIEQMINGI